MWMHLYELGGEPPGQTEFLTCPSPSSCPSGKLPFSLQNYTQALPPPGRPNSPVSELCLCRLGPHAIQPQKERPS